MLSNSVRTWFKKVGLLVLKSIKTDALANRFFLRSVSGKKKSAGKKNGSSKKNGLGNKKAATAKTEAMDHIQEVSEPMPNRQEPAKMSDEKVIFFEGHEKDLDAVYKRLTEEAAVEGCAVALPKGYLSASQINMYRTCARQFYYRYIKGIIAPPSIALIEGRAVHQSIAVGHTEMVKTGKLPPLDMMLDALHTEWDRGKKEGVQVTEDDEPDEAILRRGRIFVERYQQSHMPNIEVVVDAHGPMVERRFFVTIGELRIPLMGFIDLVASAYDRQNKQPIHDVTVLDHKVVGRAKTEDDVRSDLQLTVYSAVTRVPLVGFQSFVKNKVPVIKTVYAARTGMDWKWMEHVVQEVATAISKGVFPPTATGWQCSPTYCGYFDRCHHCKLD